MKIRLIAFSLVTLFAVFTVSDVFTNASQAPFGRTGAPGEPTCADGCHAGSATATTTAFISASSAPTTPFAGYTAGQVYNLIINVAGLNNPNAVNGTQRKGFSLTCVDSSSNATGAGTLLATNASQSVLQASGAKQYISHLNANSIGAVAFQWTAPAAGTGTVSFYAALNISNNNFGTSGDQIYTYLLHVPEIGGGGGNPCDNLGVTISGSPFNNLFCGDPITLTAGVTGDSGTVNYAWSPSGSTANITATQAGTYTVTVTDAACTAGKTATVVLTDGQGTASFAATVNSDSTVSIINSSSGAQFLTWNYGDGQIDANTASAFTYTYPDTGTYTITLQVVNACGDTTFDIETVTIEATGGPVGIDQASMGTYSVYPNPFTSYLQVEATAGQSATFRLMSLDGRVAVETAVQPNLTRIERGDIEAGLYFYYIQTNTGEVIKTGRILAQ